MPVAVEDVPLAAVPEASAETKVCRSVSSFDSRLVVPVLEMALPEVAVVLSDVAADAAVVAAVVLPDVVVDEEPPCNCVRND